MRLIKEVANHPKIAAWNKEKWGNYDEGDGRLTRIALSETGLNLRPKPKTEPKKEAEPVNPLKFLLIVALYVVLMILVVQFILPGRTGGSTRPRRARRGAPRRRRAVIIPLFVDDDNNNDATTRDTLNPPAANQTKPLSPGNAREDRP